MLLVDGNVQRAALAAVDRVHLGTILQQQQHHIGLITATHTVLVSPAFFLQPLWVESGSPNQNM